MNEDIELAFFKARFTAFIDDSDWRVNWAQALRQLLKVIPGKTCEGRQSEVASAIRELATAFDDAHAGIDADLFSKAAVSGRPRQSKQKLMEKTAVVGLISMQLAGRKRVASEEKERIFRDAMRQLNAEIEEFSKKSGVRRALKYTKKEVSSVWNNRSRLPPNYSLIVDTVKKHPSVKGRQKLARMAVMARNSKGSVF